MMRWSGLVPDTQHAAAVELTEKFLSRLIGSQFNRIDADVRIFRFLVR